MEVKYNIKGFMLSSLTVAGGEGSSTVKTKLTIKTSGRAL
jgi:hypothetical protein